MFLRCNCLGINRVDWKVKPLTIRRTVHNFSQDRHFRDDSRMDSPPYFRDTDDDDIPYKVSSYWCAIRNSTCLFTQTNSSTFCMFHRK